MIAAGKLTQYVELWEELQGPRRAHNLPAVSNRLVANVYAKIEPLSGREYLAAQQTQAEVTHRVTIRWRADVTTAMWFAWRGKQLSIESARNLEGKNEALECMCIERLEAAA